MKTAIRLFAFILLLPSVCFSQDSPRPPRPAGVVVIGLDALSVDGLQFSRTPNLDSLIGRGALSLTTRAVMPTVSGPNWTSMLTGAGPEQHGVTKNGLTLAAQTVAPVERDADGFFPSIFKIVREQKPGSKIGMFYDWNELANYLNMKYMDAEVYSDDYRENLKKAAAWIVSDRPAFTFIYIGHIDDVGHDSGHGTVAYRKSIEEVDEALGGFFAELKQGRLFDSLLFMVISDHGGVGHGHGGESMDEIEVPWIVSGPGTVAGRLMVGPNNSLNTAPTAAWALGVRAPDSWIGRPAYQAFDARATGGEYIPRPGISVASGVYLEPQRVTMWTKREDTPIRYTLDGSEPGIGSPVYREPIAIETPAIVRAVAVDRRGLSTVTRREITVVRGIRSLALASPPAEKYSTGGELTLVDTKRGSERFSDGRWLGFKGEDLDLTVDLGEPRPIGSISVGCLNDTGSWIFLPASAEIFASADGREFRPVPQASSDLMTLRKSVTGGQTFSIVPARFNDRYLRVVVNNIGFCPPGHSGAGKKAWLFVDEVTIR